MLLCIAFILILSLVPALAITVSIGNPKAILRPEVQEGESITLDRTILAKNGGNESVNVTLSPDDGLAPLIDILDKQFTLLPGEEKKARYTLTIDDPYSHEGNIIVGFSPLDGGGPSIGHIANIIIVGTKENPINLGGSLDTGNTTQELSEPEANPEANQEPSQEPNPVSVSIGGNPTAAEPETTEPTNSSGPNPLIGIALVLIILVIGGILLTVFLKTGKQKPGRKK